MCFPLSWAVPPGALERNLGGYRQLPLQWPRVSDTCGGCSGRYQVVKEQVILVLHSSLRDFGGEGVQGEDNQEARGGGPRASTLISACSRLASLSRAC